MDWITTNWVGVAAAFVAIVYAGEKIAALTANKTDDKIFGILHTLASLVALQKPSGTPPSA